MGDFENNKKNGINDDGAINKDVNCEEFHVEREHTPKEDGYLFTNTSGKYRNENLAQSLKMAFAGLTHIVWTQKHVRTQLLIIILVLLLCYAMGLDVISVLFVTSAIILILIAELFNTAIEVVVNMITMKEDPRAKIAKDVAAAGVLIASFYAFFVGCGIFFSNNHIVKGIRDYQFFEWYVSPPSPIIVLLVAFFVLTLIVILGKAKKNHGSILKGGAISAHTAVAFMLFAAIMIYSAFTLHITIMALLLAVLVAQSRVEGRIHTVREVIWGAIVAIIIMGLLIFFPTPSSGVTMCPTNGCYNIDMSGDDIMLPSERLIELNIELPEAPKPIANYVRAVKTGNLLYVSGQLPIENGKLPDRYTFIAESEGDIGVAAMAARQAAINALSIINAEVGIDNVVQIVRLNGFVSSTDTFTMQPAVIDEASKLFVAVFGNSGRHSRVAVSAASLPMGSVVELDIIVEFKAD